MVERSDLGAVGELGLISLATRRFPKARGTLRLGIGDDAALLSLGPGPLVAVSKDLLVEGVHFDLSYFSPEDLGYKAVSVNVSDICAMNGRPTAILAGISLPRHTEPSFVERLYEGIESACERYSVSLAGGDTTASPGPILLSLTILGTVDESDATTRGGANAGDLLYVSGTLGLSAAGLEILRTDRDLEGPEEAVRRHLRPEARTDVVEALREAGVLPTAMIDVSDGLASEVRHIAAASGIGVRIDASRIPVSERAARAAGKDALELALGGGEDYELLFTVPPEARAAMKRLTTVSEIGVVTADRSILIERNGEITPLPERGYRHF